MRRLLSIGLLGLIGLAWWWAAPEQSQLDSSRAESASGQPASMQSARTAQSGEVQSPLVVRNVAVRDLDGRIAWRGDVDLRPVLERIERGHRDPHRNDGGIFQNRERRLPQRPRGHYREYVVRTPGISHAGPQRLVIGNEGEVYYTADHYRSFRRLR